MDFKEYVSELNKGDRWTRGFIRLAQTLKLDREIRGRPDLKLLGAELDERNKVLWLVFGFNVNAGCVSTADLQDFVMRYLPDFEIVWDKSVGYARKGIVCLAVRSFVERIPVKQRVDGNLELPLGFKEIGGSLFSFAEVDGTRSYWRLIKSDDGFALVRIDGTLPPTDILAPFEAQNEREAELHMGDLVKVKEGFGILTSVDKKNGKYRIKLLGQTKEIEYDDKAAIGKYDPERDVELLRSYYRNVFPDEYVEELLK
jgi:hypothetical protein